MAVLVTGGAGYIGSHLVLDLVDAGEKVIVVDDLSSGFAWAVGPGAQLVEGDAGDGALIGRLLREHDVEAVIHLAGSVVVPDSLADPLAYYLNNTVRSRALIAACVSGGVRHVIFSSTAAVYGTPPGNPVHEDAPVAPISPYGRSKLMTEWMLTDAAAAYGLNYVALRYFNVAGADPRGRAGQSRRDATHLIKAACQTALGQRPRLEIFGRDFDTPDGTCIRDYVHVSDIAGVHVDALAYLRSGGQGGIFNCGYGRGFSVLEVIEAVGRASGRPLSVIDGPRRAGDPPALVAGADRARSVLGWRPRHGSLDIIVETALAWEKLLARRHSALA